jgi:hypothetical protein
MTRGVRLHDLLDALHDADASIAVERLVRAVARVAGAAWTGMTWRDFEREGRISNKSVTNALPAALRLELVERRQVAHQRFEYRITPRFHERRPRK